MTTKKEFDLVEIFAGSPMDAEIVKSILLDAEIDAFLKDENIGTIAPWHAAAGGAGAVKVIISSLNMDSAKLIVEDYINNLNSDK
ncbi:DUF2007 domain-containing protein [Labilibaculum sp. DW002]|uniref:DUF2007 domain-containing protein n=1 Tax=Paralabilibaculum antarcticum TaxID=2912572 RepID=A0ABT5VPZ0_9BACT|nr:MULTISPECIES: DUF2007 domain-containing protein [unclassified Labilibaculum]MBI9059730.1 DUF2007 domain-containing protein [Labilibaculum sp.]MDE5417315.1 DUF2007 domain-containing protein [Labilibaculum sp. DW002]